MLGASLSIALFSLWLVNRNLINPIRELTEHIAQLSRGNFGRRVDSNRQDELGHLAVAANILHDFLADTLRLAAISIPRQGRRSARKSIS